MSDVNVSLMRLKQCGCFAASLVDPIHENCENDILRSTVKMYLTYNSFISFDKLKGNVIKSLESTTD